MTLKPEIAAFYTAHGRMTDPGALAPLLADAPPGLPERVAWLQNLLLHYYWAPAYRMRLSPERKDESNTRPLAGMLALIREKDARPLARTRTLYQRMVVVCRHFAVFAVALLRQQGIPARARAGFGGYFTLGMFDDHWVAEYWQDGAWHLLDAQIDPAQRAMLRLDFDTLDVPRDKFLIAADAWTRWREGRADAAQFGVFDIRGPVEIAGNLVRDLAALNKMEMLPWDAWGPIFEAGAELTPEHLALFDKIAAATRDPDADFLGLRALYQTDPALTVPREVFNFDRQRVEPV